MTADRESEFGYRMFLVFLAIGWLSVGTDAPERGAETGIPWTEVAGQILDSIARFWIRTSNSEH